MPAVFPLYDVGKAVRNVRYCDITFSKMVNNANNADMFLNHLVPFYSNNATNLHHWTSHSTPCCPTT